MAGERREDDGRDPDPDPVARAAPVRQLRCRAEAALAPPADSARGRRRRVGALLGRGTGLRRVGCHCTSVRSRGNIAGGHAASAGRSMREIGAGRHYPEGVITQLPCAEAQSPMWVVACVRSAGHSRYMSLEAAHAENGEAPAPSEASPSRPRGPRSPSRRCGSDSAPPSSLEGASAGLWTLPSKRVRPRTHPPTRLQRPAREACELWRVPFRRPNPVPPLWDRREHRRRLDARRGARSGRAPPGRVGCAPRRGAPPRRGCRGCRDRAGGGVHDRLDRRAARRQSDRRAPGSRPHHRQSRHHRRGHVVERRCDRPHARQGAWTGRRRRRARRQGDGACPSAPRGADGVAGRREFVRLVRLDRLVRRLVRRSPALP